MKPPKSKGEKLFDKITYVGIAGVGALVLTVPVAYELEHHPSIKPSFDRAVAWAEKWCAKLPMVKDAHKTAVKVVETTTLMQGGNLMLIPVGLMEYFKVPIVRGFNAAMMDPTPEAQIEKAPKQTLLSLTQSRLLAWGVVFASFGAVDGLFHGTLEKFKEEFGTHVVKFTNRFRTEGKKISENAMEGTRTYNYGKIAALDIFATTAAATLLYLGGHFFARRQEEKKEERQERKHELVSGEHEHRNAAEADKRDAPSSQIMGSKQREGATLAPSLTQQI